MQNPADFYNQNLSDNESRLAGVKKQLALSSTVRLFIFLAAVAGGYFFWSRTPTVVAIVLLFIVVFLILVSRHTRLQYKRDFIQKTIDLNQTELCVLKRDFHHLPSGENFNNPSHFYSQDIDLFGPGSFFQYLNRTNLESGEAHLAGLLLENRIDRIPEKQKAIQELAGIPQWRQEFSATAALAKTEMSGPDIMKWLHDYKKFMPKAMGWIPLAFSLVSVTLFVLFYLDLIPSGYLFFWFILGLGLAGMYLKKISYLADRAGKAYSTFEQYYKLLVLLEDRDFKADLLRSETDKITTSGGKKASEIIRSFSKMLSALDQRNNLLVAVFGNGFFLNDLRNSFRIEKWIQENSAEVQKWFEVITFFDAQNSLGNFAFNHPGYSFANITDSKTTIKGKDLAHPLLDPQKAVANDFEINSEEFFIITGANMAGKSTFLRTISVFIVMSNTGLPVCASEASYSPIKLITSMRTTDSLTDEASYFFSELKRLQYIVQAIETDRYFIILDEILKGTNSTDKAIGSRKFIEKLVASNSTGIIATHDLSLCETAKTHPEVHNYYFDAEIKDDELFFDYTFKKGICQNMNASFLLRKMNIIDA